MKLKLRDVRCRSRILIPCNAFRLGLSCLVSCDSLASCVYTRNNLVDISYLRSHFGSRTLVAREFVPRAAEKILEKPLALTRFRSVSGHVTTCGFS